MRLRNLFTQHAIRNAKPERDRLPLRHEVAERGRMRWCPGNWGETRAVVRKFLKYLAKLFSQSFNRDFIPRVARHTHDAEGVEDISPGLPESARATLGQDVFRLTHFARSAASAASIFPFFSSLENQSTVLRF